MAPHPPAGGARGERRDRKPRARPGGPGVEEQSRTGPQRAGVDGRAVLVVLGGLPGAGKTTLLRRTFAGAAHVEVLDPEDLRRRVLAALGTARGYRLYRPAIHLAHWLRIGPALRTGRLVVVHETATRSLNRRLLALWGRRHGRVVHLVMLDVDAQTARAGQAARGRRLTEAGMRRHEERWERLRGRLHRRAPRGYASVTFLTGRTSRRPAVTPAGAPVP